MFPFLKSGMNTYSILFNCFVGRFEYYEFSFKSFEAVNIDVATYTLPGSLLFDFSMTLLTSHLVQSEVTVVLVVGLKHLKFNQI